MRPPLAWQNTFQHPLRAAVAVAGLAGVVLLLFVQLGVLIAARRSASDIYRLFDFDAVVTARQFNSLIASGVQRVRLRQAAVVPGVAWVCPLYLRSLEWRSAAAGTEVWTLLIAPDSERPVFVDTALNARLPELRDGTRALADELGGPAFVAALAGGRLETPRFSLRIVGRHRLGAGFAADGSLIVGPAAIANYHGPEALDSPNIGLIKFAAGTDPAVVLRALRAAVPRDVAVLAREELIAAEENYFVTVKPVGVLMLTGMAVALVAGVLIVHQVLAAEVLLRQREFATMRALGYGTAQVWGVGMRQSLLLGALAYGPALAAATGIFAAMRRLAGLPIGITTGQAGTVGAVVAALCLVCAITALHPLRRIDAAHLLRA